MTKLIIVESPGKIDKITSILGDGYKVVASFGHIRDLDPTNLSIDVNNNYAPSYIIPKDKGKVVTNLRYNQGVCDEVIIASDLDREGEMIAHSIMEVLKLKDPKRIVFNEITKKAILDAVANPGTINNNMVMAQQTRRLLDRLVGYKISPLLWKQLDLRSIELNKEKSNTLSAGRVQSVVVRIIVDLENEIASYQTNPYYKMTAVFNHNNSDINSILMKNNTIYKIEEKDVAMKILNSINKKTTCIISDVRNKEHYKSPPPPHITSSLMQEASTRYNMNSKRTMEVAQKLYEAGYITYMRTDSTNLSKEAVADCKQYIEKTFGTNYYSYRAHKTKSKDAQEAHEAIRPTKIECSEVNINEDCKKLYRIIWNRTLASLMTDAKLNIMTVEIDCRNGVSIFEKDVKFIANYTTILFDGYMILTNTIGIDMDEDSENITSKDKIDIIKDTIVDFNKMEASEEYTKPPLRYNEAGLIKTMKKNGIGRPSTYASIISKIMERNYVSINNIEGVSKEVVTFSVLNKKFEIKEKTKTITIGKEKMKIIPTQIGIMVNTFMMKNFEPIMDIKFTADMEKMLDKVAVGKAEWFNVLDIYYKKFSPMVDIIEKMPMENKKLKVDDKVIGIHPILQQTIFLTNAKFGYCIKMMENDKWRYASIDDIKPEDITLEKALNFLEYPKQLGKIGTSIVTLNKGKFGLYFKVGTKSIAIKDASIEPTLEYAKQLADNVHDNNSFQIKSKTVYLKNGQYGYYLMSMNGTKKPTNIPVPKNIDVNTLTAKIVLDIIENNKAKPKYTTYANKSNYVKK